MMKPKITLAIVLIILCGSCGRVSQKEYEELKETCETYRQAAESAREMSVEQAELLDSALIGLSDISDKALELNDIQERSARKSCAQELQQRLAAVKAKVEALDKASAENKRLKGIVESLKSAIAEREQTIADLQQEIESNRLQIRKGRQTIEEQLEQLRIVNDQLQTTNNSLQQTEGQLQKALREQADMIFEAAQNFEEMWREAPKKTLLSSKGKRHKGNLREKAMEYYLKSAQYGADKKACEEALDRLKFE